jgi:hypothetical protein
MTEPTPQPEHESGPDQGKASPVFTYFFFTVLAAMVSVATAAAFGRSTLPHFNVGALLLWFPAAVVGLFCAARICRLCSSGALRVLGGLLLVGHGLSLVLVVLLGALWLLLQRV